MTQPQNHESRGRAVLATWGPRCDRVLFMSTAADPVLNTIVLPVAEGRENLWYKVQAAFLYIYAHHRHEYDWVLKADDDTYVVVENLRRMLYDYRPHDLWYFGCRFRAHNGVEFMSGGAGYVLSRAATIVLAERGITGGECTESAGGVDDYAMGEWGGDARYDRRDIKECDGIGFFFDCRHMFEETERDIREISGSDRSSAIPAVCTGNAFAAELCVRG